MLDEERIDVIIPVYNQRELVEQCITSVLSAPCSTSYRLIVIDDCSPDPATRSYLDNHARDGSIELIRNDENVGFTRSVNRGMRLSYERDVVLLNSDTVVYGNWLDRLLAAAYSDDRVATANPMTNVGGSHISPYPNPKFFAPIPISRHREIDEVARAENAGRYAYVHTTVGFCMFIKRRCLQEIGFFDALNFPVGYGEESDACYRAAKLGWKHVVAGDVFVSHLEGRSFGARKQKLMADMIVRFRQLHPELDRLDRRFAEVDPLRRLRAGIDRGILKSLIASDNTPVEIIALQSKDVIESVRNFTGLVFEIATGTLRFGGRLVPYGHDLGPYYLPRDIARLNHDLGLMGISELLCRGRETKAVLEQVCSGLPDEIRLGVKLAA